MLLHGWKVSPKAAGSWFRATCSNWSATGSTASLPAKAANASGIFPSRLNAIVPGHERASFLEQGRRHKRHIVAAGVVAGVLVLAGAWYAFVPRVGVASGEIVPLRIFRDCPDCPELVEIPPGIYERGSRSVEPGHLDTEGPVTRVTIKRSFAIGRYPVTFGE